MQVSEDVSVQSLLGKHKYETNIHTVEEKNYEAPLYKIRVTFNDMYSDICVAIGDVKELEQVEYKYVYAVKYEKVVSKLGLYEFIKGGEQKYNENGMLLFDNYANSIKLKNLQQSKDEYIMENANNVKRTRIMGSVEKKKEDTGDFSDKYDKLLSSIRTGGTMDQTMRKIVERSLHFYDDTRNDQLDFIRGGELDHTLINELKGIYIEKYENVDTNEFLRIIFVDPMEQLEKLDEFENKGSVTLSPLNQTKSLLKHKPEEANKEEHKEENDEEENDEEENDEEENSAENSAENREEYSEENSEENSEKNSEEDDEENGDEEEDGEEEDGEEEDDEASPNTVINKNVNATTNKLNATPNKVASMAPNKTANTTNKLNDVPKKTANDTANKTASMTNTAKDTKTNTAKNAVPATDVSNMTGGRMKLLKRKMKL